MNRPSSSISWMSPKAPASRKVLPSNGICEFFEEAVRISGVVGAQLSIIRDEEQLDFVHGLANAELGIPMTRDTVVQVGSVTKLFNAAMIMSLVEERKVDLDTPVQCYFPEFEIANPTATRTITLRHLLSMSAGIDNGNYGDYGDGEDAIGRRVAALKRLPQHFAPGKHFGYSNAGIDISGRVAECVTGQVWDALLNERVLEPAGLSNPISLARDRVFRRVSVGHTFDPETGRAKVIRPWDGISRGLAPAGSTLAASAHDLARFGKLFIGRGVAESGIRVLGESSIRAMMEPHVKSPIHYYATEWCLGPFVTEWSTARVWGHPGGNASGGSFLCWVPERKGVMAYTFNVPSLPVHARILKVMTQEVMQAAFGTPNPGIHMPASPVNVKPSRYVGTYRALAGECSVECSGKDLIMTTRCSFSPGYQYTETSALRPLGEDRFLLDKGADADPMALPQDIAFFGDDGGGRATNLTCMLFPFSRIN